MRRRFSAITLVVLALMLMTSVAAFAQQTTTVPPSIDVPVPGSTVISGHWDPRCVGVTVVVTDSDGIVIGTGIIDEDGNFIVELTRPLVAGEEIKISSECGPSAIINPQVPEIPEAGTLLMLGSGLVGVAGYAGLRWRARK